MPAVMQINQVGLPAGIPGFARSDGIVNAEVSIISTQSNVSVVVQFRWKTEADDTATLVQFSPTEWRFTPKPGIIASYDIEMFTDDGLGAENRTRHMFAIRHPNSGLRYPLLNELADPTMSLLSGASQITRGIDVSVDNEPQASGPFITGSYGGWYRMMMEMVDAIEAGGGGGGGGTLQQAYTTGGTINYDPAVGSLNPLSFASSDDILTPTFFTGYAGAGFIAPQPTFAIAHPSGIPMTIAASTPVTPGVDGGLLTLNSGLGRDGDAGVEGGDGGQVTMQALSGGLGSTFGASGAGGPIALIAGDSGASVSNSAVGVGGFISAQAGAGGLGQGTAVGGDGGALGFFSGNAGSPGTVSVGGTGGAAGALNFTGGIGSNASVGAPDADGGQGGRFIFTGGKGGAGYDDSAGTGGSFTVNAGDGGDILNDALGSAGGDIILQAGVGSEKTGGTTGGSAGGGLVQIRAGAGGNSTLNASGNGGDIDIKAGFGGDAPTGGIGGGYLIEAGDGGDSSGAAVDGGAGGNVDVEGGRGGVASGGGNPGVHGQILLGTNPGRTTQIISGRNDNLGAVDLLQRGPLSLKNIDSAPANITDQGRLSVRDSTGIEELYFMRSNGSESLISLGSDLQDAYDLAGDVNLDVTGGNDIHFLAADNPSDGVAGVIPGLFKITRFSSAITENTILKAPDQLGDLAAAGTGLFFQDGAGSNQTALAAGTDSGGIIILGSSGGAAFSQGDGGNSVSFQIQGGTGGIGAGTGQSGDSSGFVFTGAAGTNGPTNGSAGNGGPFNITLGDGGDSVDGAAGGGGGSTFVLGDGGGSTGGLTTSAGGIGGAFALTTGAGGFPGAFATAPGAAGGDFIITTGLGGESPNDAGRSGQVRFIIGNGGINTSNNQGGASGDFTVFIGVGGNATSAGGQTGDGGDINLTAGRAGVVAAGAGTHGVPGNLNFQAGRGSSSFVGGIVGQKGGTANLIGGLGGTSDTSDPLGDGGDAIVKGADGLSAPVGAPSGGNAGNAFLLGGDGSPPPAANPGGDAGSVTIDAGAVDLVNPGAEGTVSIGTTDAISIASGKSDSSVWTHSGQFVVTDNSANTLPPLTLQTTGTNGGTSAVFVGTIAPVHGAGPGSLYMRTATPELYQNIAGTTWSRMLNEIDIPISGMDTGVLVGGNITAGAVGTVTITDGNGLIQTFTPANFSTPNAVSWTGLTNVAITNILTEEFTFLMINSSGSLIQLNAVPTESQLRANIALGWITHFDNVNVDTIVAEPALAYSAGQDFRTFSRTFEPLKLNGVDILGVTSTLSIELTAGTLFGEGSNFHTDPNNPSVRAIAGQNPLTFDRIYNDGIFAGDPILETAGTTFLDPANYNNAGVLTAVGGTATRTTLQRVYITPTGNFFVSYGQEFYSDLATALSAAGSEVYLESTLELLSTLIGRWAISRAATDTTDTNEAVFLETSGAVGGGSSGGGGEVNEIIVAADATGITPVASPAKIGTILQAKGFLGTAANVSVVAAGANDIQIDLIDTAVTPAVYTNTNLTVDAKGRITAAASGAGIFVSVRVQADEWEFANVADYAISNSAGLTKHPTLGSVIVIAYDDTTEEGMSRSFRAPAGTTNLTLQGISASAAASGTATMQIRARALIGGSWSAPQSLGQRTYVSDTFQDNLDTISLASLSISPLDDYQLLITRDVTDTGVANDLLYESFEVSYT